jgi:hypothetical protein
VIGHQQIQQSQKFFEGIYARVAHEFGAGHDVYFYFIASVILPLSKN